MIIGKLSLVVIASALFSACGTYNRVVQMLPETGDGWTQPGWGVLERNYKCDGQFLNVSRSLAYSRKVARAFFGIPVPWTAEDKPIRDITQPLIIGLSFGPNNRIKSCLLDLVHLKGTNSKTDIYPLAVNHESHNREKALHFCTYEFPPLDKIGNEFYMYFAADTLSCEIKPVLFRREDTTTYFPVLVQ